MQSTNHLKVFKQSLIEISPLILCSNLLGLVPAIYSLQVLDEVIKIESKFTLLTYLTIALIFVGIDHFFKIIKNDKVRVIFTKFDEDIKNEVLIKSQEINPKQYNHLIRHASVEVFNNVENLRRTLSGGFVQSLTEIPFTIIGLTTIALIAPQMLLICIFAVSTIFIFSLMRQAETKQLEYLESKDHLEFKKNAFENFVQRNEARSNGLDAYISNKLEKSYLSWGKNSLRKSVREDSLKEFLTTVQVISLILSTTLGSYLIIENKMTVGALIACNILISKALAPLFVLIINWSDVLKIREYQISLDEFLNIKTERSGAKYTVAESESLLPSITIKDACINKPSESPGSIEPLISNINLTLKPGLVLVLGDNGAGKSSLLKSIAGFWQFDSGELLLECANPLSNNYLENVNLFTQDYELDFINFESFVSAKNKVVNSPEVMEALRVANAKNILLQHPQSEKMVLSKRSFLSEGQLKRIVLGLSVINRKPIYIFDEPTNSLDSESKKNLVRWIVNNKTNAIIICASHDEALISQADSFIKISDKKLIYRTRAQATGETINSRVEKSL